MTNENEFYLEKEGGEPSEFEKNGGKILETNEDGTPRRWFCGIGENGEKIHPPGIDPKKVFCKLNSEKKWEGSLSAEDLEEIKKWRSDWGNPEG